MFKMSSSAHIDACALLSVLLKSFPLLSVNKFEPFVWEFYPHERLPSYPNRWH